MERGLEHLFTLRSHLSENVYKEKTFLLINIIPFIVTFSCPLVTPQATPWALCYQHRWRVSTATHITIKQQPTTCTQQAINSCNRCTTRRTQSPSARSRGFSSRNHKSWSWRKSSKSRNIYQPLSGTRWHRSLA